MKLLGATIEGFRAFTQRAEIDLSADVTILVGPNGTGKTSLLDALLWGITGRLKRVGKDHERVLSLYAPAGLARVSVTMEDKDGRLSLVRTLLEGSESLGVTIGDRVVEGRIAEAALVQRLWDAGSSSPHPLDDLHEVLTRSVYLQQDLVRQFIDRDTEAQRFDAIGNLVGLGRIADFQRKLVASVKAWATVRNQKEVDLQNAEARLSAISEDIERIGESERPNTEQSWISWWTALAESGLGVRPVPNLDMPGAAQTLDQMLRGLQAARTSSQRKLSTVPQVRLDFVQVADSFEIPEVRIDKLRDDIGTLRALCERLGIDLRKAEEQDAAVRAELLRQRNVAEEMRTLAQLALRHLSEHCPVCEQSIDAATVENRLKNLVDEVPGESPDFRRETIRVTQELEKARSDLRLAERALSEALDVNRQVAVRRALLNSQLADLELENPTLESLDALAEALQTRVESIAEAYRAGEVLSLEIARRSEQSKRRDLSSERARMSSLAELARVDFEQYKWVHEEASRVVEAVRQVSDDAVNRQIRRIAPLLQKIYTRIDPHPTFRIAELRSRISYGKGRVETPVIDSRNAGGSIEIDSPADIFSSSQTNALAVAIFLAINLSSSDMPLDAAILDDPLQSLDDINLLGLLDALRRMRKNRQLLISTHDDNFAALLRRKFRPLEQGQRTSVVRMRNWERKGVSLEQNTEAQVPPRLQVVS